MSDATALYRHFDRDGTLLYVGISLHAIYRLGQHQESDWSRHIARVDIQTYTSRAAALEAERRAIRIEQPIFNKIHNGGRRQYLGATGAPARRAAPSKPKIPIEDGDEWLNTSQINRLPPAYRAARDRTPPTLQLVAYHRTGDFAGTVRGGARYWRKTDLESLLPRKWLAT